MKQVYLIDQSGYYVRPVEIDEKTPIPNNCVEKTPTQGKGVYKHRWNGFDWEEGLSPSEINSLKPTTTINPVEELQRQYVDLVFELMNKGVL